MSQQCVYLVFFYIIYNNIISELRNMYIGCVGNSIVNILLAVFFVVIANENIYKNSFVGKTNLIVFFIFTMETGYRFRVV